MNRLNSTSVPKRVAVVAVTALVAMSAFLSLASTAALATPKGIFAKFAQCPTSIPGVKLCQYAEVTSGELAIGSLRVPVDKKIVFQGGAMLTGSPNFNEYFLLPATNSESVSPTELDVPGGLRDILGCREHHDRARHGRGPSWPDHACHGRYDEERDPRDSVTATFESAAGPSNPAILDLGSLALEEGTALIFPVRLHLHNPLLGEACYLGSEAHPIEPRLTDGTTSPPAPNQPIAGKRGKAASEFENGYEATSVTENTLVDNAFSVPTAEGCGTHGHEAQIDARIDQTLGLESPAGRNTAILNGTHYLAEIEAVIASETFPAKEESTNKENPTSPHHHHHKWWWSEH